MQAENLNTQQKLKPATFGKTEVSMFTSQRLISRKGPFGVIWIAAHCLKRLKKYELTQTDVLHSVENILEVGVPAANHRILAFLLLGVVRIYSKKVEFLFHDCCDVLSKVGHLQGGKKVIESIEVLRKSYDFVSLPERFELDAFDLDILDDQNVGGKNVRSNEDISNPSDTPGGRKMHSDDKHHMVEDTACSGLYPVYTPVRDVFSPCFVKGNLDVAMLCDKSHSKSSIETLCGKFFSEERLEPFKYAEKELGYDMLCSASNSTNLEFLGVHPTDTEVIREEEHDEIRLPDEPVRDWDNSCGIWGRVSEERLESLDFEDMGEEEPAFALLSNDRFQSDGEMMKHVDSTVNIEEPDDFINPSIEEKEIEKKGQSVSISLPNKKQPLSINTDFASDSKFPAAPDSIAVRTPATKEKSRLLKKRKCLFDEIVVLPNKEIKQMIEDSSDLVCKRRKAPLTVSQAWKARKILSLLEPLIPCKAADYGSMISNLKTSTAMETETEEETPLNQVSSKSLAVFGCDEETPIAPGMQVSTKSLATFGSDEEAPIAPGTPVTHLTSLRMHEARGLSRCDTLRRSSSLDSFKELFRLDEAQEVDSSSTDKVADQEKDDAPTGCEVKKYEYSARTRKVASYLLRQLVKQRKLTGEDSMVGLTQIVESKSKRESARLFHEILVLKSGDYIQVKQERAYGDIWLEETPKLKDFVGSSEANLN